MMRLRVGIEGQKREQWTALCRDPCRKKRVVLKAGVESADEQVNAGLNKWIPRLRQSGLSTKAKLGSNWLNSEHSHIMFPFSANPYSTHLTTTACCKSYSCLHSSITDINLLINLREGCNKKRPF